MLHIMFRAEGGGRAVSCSGNDLPQELLSHIPAGKYALCRCLHLVVRYYISFFVKLDQAANDDAAVEIAVIDLPHISNFTDFDAFGAERDVRLRIIRGEADAHDNPLKHAPHPVEAVCGNVWPHAYSREQAAFPLPYLRRHKFWPAVARIDNVHGDRNLVCTCDTTFDK